MPRTNKWLWIGLVAALLIGIFVSPFASSHPDGLERAAEDLGFMNQTQEPLYNTPFTDYEATIAPNAWLATSISGAVGVLLTFFMVWGTGRWVARRRKIQ
jgi:cobalt/nickel transport protein